jgi:hypothetical protein
MSSKSSHSALNIVVEWLAFVLRIREVSGLDLGPEINYPDRGCKWFSSVGFEVLTAVSTKMAVFWVVTMVALMMEAAMTSKTLVIFYQTIRRYNPEDSHLRTHRRENLKSYLDYPTVRIRVSVILNKARSI